MKKLWWFGLGLFCAFGIWLWCGKEPDAEPESQKYCRGQKVPLTNFYCHSLLHCDGKYIQAEEGTTALLLENTGNIGYDRVQIVVVQNGKRLRFETEDLPPYGWVVLFEENMTPFSGDSYEDVYCLTAIPEA